MWRSTRIIAALALAGAGCASHNAPPWPPSQPYMAGQPQGGPAPVSQPLPEVYVRGPVRHPTVDWTDDLTLAQAIVAADYTGFMNPVLVRVIRHGQVAETMRGVDLLRHKDVPLEPGDIIVLTGE